MNNWISCLEKLPEDDEDQLVTDGRSIGIAFFYHEQPQWFAQGQILAFPTTHWMPLPSLPPKEAK